MYDFTGDFETFFTGETDSTMSGLYDTFRGSSDLPQWNGKHCSNIQNASDGTKFKSFIKNDEELLFFRKSMCRPQRLVSKTKKLNRQRVFSYQLSTQFLSLIQIKKQIELSHTFGLFKTHKIFHNFEGVSVHSSRATWCNHVLKCKASNYNSTSIEINKSPFTLSCTTGSSRYSYFSRSPSVA